MSSGSPRPEPSPQLGFGFGPHPDDADNRPRSRSQRLLDKLPSSVSDHLGRRRSRSPDGIGAGLTQAGLVLGSTGSEYLINRSIQEIRDGAKAFLVELNRLANDARIESKRPGVKRVNTEMVEGRIQVFGSLWHKKPFLTFIQSYKMMLRQNKKSTQSLMPRRTPSIQLLSQPRQARLSTLTRLTIILSKT